MQELATEEGARNDTENLGEIELSKRNKVNSHDKSVSKLAERRWEMKPDKGRVRRKEKER